MAVTKHEVKRTTIDLVDITVTEGQTLKVETTPDGEEALNEVCPAGETWIVTMHIEIAIKD